MFTVENYFTKIDLTPGDNKRENTPEIVRTADIT